MLTLDDGVTLQPVRGEMHSCISPGAGSWIYCESVTVPPYLPSTTTCTPFALLQKSITSCSFFSFPLFFNFFFHGAVYSPMLPASSFGERGSRVGWSLGSLHFCHLSIPSPPTSSQQGVLGERSLLLWLQEELFWASWAWTAKGAKLGKRGGQSSLPFVFLTRYQHCGE